MNWDNYLQHGWHLDHIRPCATFDLKDEEKQKVCFNWRNLQPLWGRENVIKSESYDLADEVDCIQLMRDLGYEGELFPLYEE